MNLTLAGCPLFDSYQPDPLRCDRKDSGARIVTGRDSENLELLIESVDRKPHDIIEAPFYPFYGNGPDPFLNAIGSRLVKRGEVGDVISDLFRSQVAEFHIGDGCE